LKPVNDHCDDALDLGSVADSQSIWFRNSTVGATSDIDEVSCWVSRRHGVWYKFSVAFPAEITVSTCNEFGSSTAIVLYSGVCGSLICPSNYLGTCSERVYSDDIDTDYFYIRVEDYSGNIRYFGLTLSVSAIYPVSNL